MSAIDGINALSQAGRARALDAARTRIAGQEPQLEDFTRKSYSKYPPEHTQRMKRLGYGLLVPAFFGSAIRIFLAAFETNATYLTGTQHPSALSVPLAVAVLVGLTSVLLAETGQVAFTLWASSVPDDARAMRAGLTLGAVGCMVFALAANIYVVKPNAITDIGASVLAWIETLLPPLLVMIAANVLKALALNDMGDRHAAQMAYDTQHADWTARKQAAPSDAQWMQVVANELRDAIRNENRRSYAKLRELTNNDWRTLVLREMAADNWYAQSEPTQTQALPASVPAVTVEAVQPAPVRVRAKPVQSVGTSNSSGRHTGEFANAVSINADGTHTGTCPHCGWVSDPKASARSAQAALIAHKRSCAGSVDVVEVAQRVIEGVDHA